MREWPIMRFGNLAVFLLAFVALSGVGLLFHYRPTVETAYLDLVDLREVSRFGFLRDLHLWGSHAAIITVWLHLLRTALRARYHGARRHDWTVGVLLMILTTMLAATGSLLPWDQDAYWGIANLSASASAGTESAAIGDSTLLLYYVLHCFVLPASVTALAVYHLRRARRRPTLDVPAAREPS